MFITHQGSGDDLKFIYSLQDYRDHLDPTMASALVEDLFLSSSEVGITEEVEPFSIGSWEVDVNAIHSSTRPFRSRHRDRAGAGDDVMDRSDTKADFSLNLSSSISDSTPGARKVDLPIEPSSVTFNPSIAESPVPYPSHSSSFSSQFGKTNHSFCSPLRSRTHSGGAIDPRGLPHEPKPASYIDPRYRSWHWYRHLSIHDKIPGGTKMLRKCQRVIDIGFNAEQFLLLGEVCVACCGLNSCLAFF